MEIKEINKETQEYYKTNPIANAGEKVNGQSTQPEFNWDDFNKNTGLEFKSFDEIKGLKNEHSEYQKQVTDWKPKIEEWQPIVEKSKTYESHIAELEELARKNADPLTAFDGDKDLYIETKLKKLHPEKANLIKDALNIKDKNPIEAIILEKQYRNPEISREEIIDHLNKRYEIEDIMELAKLKPTEWPKEIDKFSIMEDFNLAKEKLGGLPGEVKLPEFTDPTIELKQKREEKENKEKTFTEGWAKILSDPKLTEGDFGEIVLQDIDENGKPLKEKIDGKDVEVPPYLSYKIDPEFLRLMPSDITRTAKENNIDPTPENLKMLADFAKGQYYLKNVHKINKEFKQQLKAQWDVELSKKLHVPPENIVREQQNGATLSKAEQFALNKYDRKP